MIHATRYSFVLQAATSTLEAAAAATALEPVTISKEARHAASHFAAFNCT